MGTRGRDEGLTAAIAAAGGLGRLAAALGVKRQSIEWARVPQGRLFEVARICGLDPARLRPDLAAWIDQEKQRRRMSLARERFALVKGACGVRLTITRQSDDELTIDLLTTMRAARFVAERRGVAYPAVLVGRSKEAAAARALAMALAHVGGRAKSPAIGLFFGVSRQNVDNASERYLRARDGDDGDDVVARGRDGAPRVMERGRLRRAKEASAELWALEGAFVDALGLGDAKERA
jgi:hypothetical protein